MKFIQLILIMLFSYSTFYGQVNDTIKDTHKAKEKEAIKFNLNESGSHFIQLTMLNQTWLRYNENNDSTTVFNKYQSNTIDVGLRRTRFQLLGKITDRTFVYFQFGQNNFNAAYNYTSNRKIAAFIHDALCEYKLSNKDQLKIGGGLTVLNGLSRFSQPSISSIMTTDVPVFLQYSVDQTDQFDRRLSVYARGQLSKFDYRVYISNPFPINSNGLTPAPLSKNANFVNNNSFAPGKAPGIHYQYGTYLTYNIFETEGNLTPYMPGTYLGKKKVWNISFGAVYQKNAMWLLSKNEMGVFADTSFSNMLHLGIETFIDLPINKEKGTAVSAFAGYYNTNYGKNYIRFNGAMNPATGGTAKNMLQSNAYGNAFPMFGTGEVFYSQVGVLLPKKLLGNNNGQLLPYASMQYANYEYLNHKNMMVFNLGASWLIKEHNSKISIDYQSRPTYYYNSTLDVKEGKRKNAIVLQYQIFF